MTKKTGKLIGIARRAAKRAPMEELRETEITTEGGVVGDTRGRQRGTEMDGRQITVLSADAWGDVCAELDAEVPWTFRRANLLVEGLDLKETEGARIVIGDVELEVTEEVDPCKRMDEQHQGLTAALVPDWRGGAGCRVLSSGTIKVGDTVTLET